jgi:hypothetical protein
VVSDLDGKKILRGFQCKLAILRNLDDGIQMVEGHYFKIVSTIYSSNWNSISSRFHRAAHFGVTARVASPSVQEIVVTRDMALAFWIYMYNYIQIFCTCSGSCASLSLSFSD